MSKIDEAGGYDELIALFRSQAVEVASLQARVQELQEQRSLSNHQASDHAYIDEVDAPSTNDAASRRRFLRMAGGAAAGLVAVSVGTARPAAADDGDDIRQGTNTTGPHQTSITNTTSSAVLSETAAIKGVGGGNAVGVFGESSGTAGAGVIGYSPVGYGVVGRSTGGYSVYAQGVSRYGMGAHIPTDGAPTGGDYFTGDFFKNAIGELYVCVAGGTAGGGAEFRKIAGAATAGSYHPLTPIRVLDTRAGAALLPGESNGRVVSITGVIPSVPSGPRAIAATVNITVTQTVGSGFLTAYPTNAPLPNASVINWSSPGSTVANGAVIKLGISNDFKLVASPNSTHVLVDVMGYWL